MKLKDIFREIFPSQEMAEYLSTQQLSAEKIAEAVRGAPISLIRKRELLYILAEDYEETLYREQANEIDRAIQELEAKPGELFYIQSLWMDRESWDTDRYGMAPYLTIERSLQGIREEEDVEEVDGDSLCWYAIEKWCPDGEGNLHNPITYFVVDDMLCYFQKGHAGTRIWESYFESTDLNLPVPFQPGDIVEIDCRPFAPVTRVAILEVGDNHDCCSLWALFPCGDGQWGQGAVKHAHVYSHCLRPALSPLYRIVHCQGSLSEAEQILFQISQYLQGDEERGRALGDFLHETPGSRKDYATSAEILAYIEEKDGLSTVPKANI